MQKSSFFSDWFNDTLQRAKKKTCETLLIYAKIYVLPEY